MNPGSPSSLLHCFENQDRIFSSAFSILEAAIDAHAFPAASVAVTHRGSLVALKALGHFTYDDDEMKVAKEKVGAPLLASFARKPALSLPKGGQGAVYPSTLFDLASLTKVVATTPAAMILYERGLLDLDAPLAAVTPEFLTDSGKDPRRKEVTLRQLFTHSSGLPAYEKLFLAARTPDELLHAAFTTPLAADPATRAEYSDIGFIILGAAFERLADEPLDRFCQREIFAPLAMTSTTFNPPAEIRAQIPPTADEREKEEKCGAGAPSASSGQALAREMPKAPPPSSVSQPSTFRRRIIQGEVQDENAYVLGGVAPHAGLFSAAADLANYAHCLLTGGHPILCPETIALFTRREPAPPGTSRALGWDTPSAPSQSGKYFSPQSYGHLGYTGTSLWIDPTRQLSITLLTNRTWPDCSNHAIKKIRPAFHDAVIEALESSALMDGAVLPALR
jgi:serine-type D-Ala-D-Ala carboxypeptidase